MGKSQSVTTGYRYYLGIHAGLCHGPVDELVEIRGGDNTLWSGSVTSSQSIAINAPNAYGGDKKEGGVVGTLDVQMGEPTQGANSYLTNLLGTLMPAFRGIVTTVYHGGAGGIVGKVNIFGQIVAAMLNIGARQGGGQVGSNNPYPKPWAYRLRRWTAGWDGGAAWYPAKAPIPLGAVAAAGVTWRYFVTTGGDSTDRSGIGFDDSAWATGTYPMGNAVYLGVDSPSNYGFSNTVGTSIPAGSRVWTRAHINLSVVPANFQFECFVDDIIEVYLNGVHAGTVSDSGGYHKIVSLPSTGLVVGDNVIAIRLTDTSGTGARIWFDWTIRGLTPVTAMNPAHIVYECLTNRDWGMGYPAAIIDTAAFQASADVLFNEGLGLCLLWQRTDTIENFLQTIMDHAGAVLVQSKTTGLFQFNLIRGGYSIGSLPVMGPDNVLEIQSLEAPSITGATNEIIVQWFDPVGKTTQSTTVQALGAIQAQGVIVSAQKDYPGLASADLAARIGHRDLATSSVPLKRTKLKLDRTAYGLLPGGLFVLNLPEHGFNNMPMRIGEVDYGTLLSGGISISAVEDVFDMPLTTYLQTQPSGWAVPDMGAHAPTVYVGIEATYRDVYRELSAADFALVTASDAYAGIAVAMPAGNPLNYQIWSRVGGAAFAQHGGEDFCPNATLGSSLTAFATTMTIANGVGLDQISLPCSALIGSEIVAVTAIDGTTGNITIGRGCVDTIAAAHASGARIWFPDHHTGIDGVTYFSGETVDFQPLTTTSGDTLALGSGPTISIPLVARQSLPYPPAWPTIGGTRCDLVSSVSGAFTLAWRERNRVTQMDQLVDQTAATLTPEVNTRYGVEIRDGTGALLVTRSDIGATSASITLNYTGNVTLKLWSISDNGASLQSWSFTFAYTPPGGTPTNTITAPVFVPVYNGTIIDGGHA
jgi:hypothetical protein